MTSLPKRIARSLLPRFLGAGTQSNPYASFRNYTRAWLLTVAALCTASLLPVVLITILDFRATRRALQREHELQTLRFCSNGRRAVSHFLEERLDALAFASHGIGNGNGSAGEPIDLDPVLKNLKGDFGGLGDLGVIDETGLQTAYSGPFNLMGKRYDGQDWFEACLTRGAYVSEVFRGYRGVPHVVIAVKAARPDGRPFLLRASLDLQNLRSRLLPYAPGEQDDIFLINHEGLVQTPTLHHGEVLERATIAVPPPSGHTETLLTPGDPRDAERLGYAYIRTRLADTPFILVLVRGGSEIVRFTSWLLASRVAFFVSTVLGVIVVVSLAAAHLFNRLHDSDRERAHTLGHLEEVNRLVSLGRLAAGVAHEINNPLAVIKESAGYLRDLLASAEGGVPESEIEEQADVIVESATRCGAITRQLLSFARPSGLRARSVDVGEVIRDVMRFQVKEAEYRNISVSVDVAPEVPEIETDRGKLQEILLNLVMNAFDAMPDGGRLAITARATGRDEVSIDVADTGCGMSEETMLSAFEPFFTTKPEGLGTGLGLSITYGLVGRLEGRISVKSRLGEGTRFTVVLPVRPENGDGS